MKRGAPGRGGSQPAARSCAALLLCYCTVALHTTSLLYSCVAQFYHRRTARHGTSPPPSLSGCAPVAGLRAAGGKHFGASFDSFDSSAGGSAPVPWEEETVRRKGKEEEGEEGKRDWPGLVGGKKPL